MVLSALHKLDQKKHAVKTILIIGAGHQQIPAIKKAKQMGLRVVCVDKNPSAPGHRYADKAFTCDITSKRQVLDIARKSNAAAVMTMQSDLPVPTVGYVNSAMNLAGIDAQTADICSNKHLMRKVFAAGGVNQPDFLAVENSSDCLSAVRSLGFPCVIKPADASGSRGVLRITQEHEVQHAYQKARGYSLSGTVVVEKYITGREIGAQTFSIDGVCELICIHNDVISKGRHKMPVGHSYPFVPGNVDVDCLKSEIQKAISCLKIHSGPANVDIIISEKGEPNIIEIGARIGSNALPELTSHYLGIDWVECTIRSALGDRVDFQGLASNPCAATMLRPPGSGILSDVIIPGRVSGSPDVIGLELTAGKGDSVCQPTNGTHMIGKIVVSGLSAQSAQAMADKMSKEIIIRIDKPSSDPLAIAC